MISYTQSYYQWFSLLCHLMMVLTTETVCLFTFIYQITILTIKNSYFTICNPIYLNSKYILSFCKMIPTKLRTFYPNSNSN